MKILRVSFRNLNSLRGDQPHEVDFENGPLRGVSLFAITGPTGSGKSTLLDAITLALYGRAARYGDTSNPEGMMSRHCGECHASVEFAVDAVRYRAEWHLRRARKRPDGEVQPPRRYLYDAQNVPLAQGVREANEHIERIIGLDYGRFLRSVMLAQGEFARFLKAGANERAELLECLTGTEIYSELGTLAHEEASRRQAELAGREQALGAITLLTDGERQECSDALAVQQAAADRAQRERNGLLDQLNRARELATALADERDILRQQAELLTRQQDAQPDLDRLRTHRRTLPFADALSRLDAAADQVRAQHGKLADAESAHARTSLEHRRTLAAAAGFGGTLVAEQQRRYDHLCQQVVTHENRHQTLGAWLEAHAHDGAELEAVLPGLVRSLHDLAHQRTGLDETRRKADGLAAEAARQEDAVRGARQALETAGAALAARTTEKTAADDAVRFLLAGHTMEDRRAEADALQHRMGTLQTLAAQAEQRMAREKKLADDRASLSAQEAAWATATAEAADLENKRQAAEGERVLRADHLLQSKAWQSYEAQRAKLQSGDECPLCGAVEHPFAHGHRPVVSPTQIEAALAETVARIEGLDASLLTARAAQTRAETNKALLENGIRQGEAEVAGATGEIIRLAAGLGLTDNTPEFFHGAMSKVFARQKVITEGLEQLQDAEKLLNAREIERLQAEHGVQTATAAEEAAAKRQQELQTLVSLETESLRETEGELAVATGALADRLAPFGHAAPGPGHEADLCKIIGEQQRFYRQESQARQEVQTAITALRHDAESCRETLADLTRRVGELRAADASGLSGLEELCAGWRELDDATKAVLGCQTGAQLAGANVDRQRREVEEARVIERELADRLGVGLVEAGFAGLEELRAGRLDEAVAGRLEALERELEGEGNRLRGNLETIRQRLETLRAAGAVEDGAAGELEARHAVAEQTCQESLKEVGQRQKELVQDDENRQRQAAGATALAAEGKRLLVWRRLQALIGSHDGAKFRRFAQGISLDLLVHRANRHLRRLNDRYELCRRVGEELDLDIVDHHQAGVTRPLASLSGGESFLSSLALALGLADLAGRNVRIDSLFIDEGFGTLDAESLDLAINALDRLRRDRKTVGVISHVELLKERIPTQIVLEKGAGGVSRLSVRC